MYKNAKQPVADSLAQQFKGLHKAAYHRFYIDEIYQFITHKIISVSYTHLTLPTNSLV